MWISNGHNQGEHNETRTRWLLLGPPQLGYPAKDASAPFPFFEKDSRNATSTGEAGKVACWLSRCQARQEKMPPKKQRTNGMYFRYCVEALVEGHSVCVATSLVEGADVRVAAACGSASGCVSGCSFFGGFGVLLKSTIPDRAEEGDWKREGLVESQKGCGCLITTTRAHGPATVLVRDAAATNDKLSIWVRCELSRAPQPLCHGNCLQTAHLELG